MVFGCNEYGKPFLIILYGGIIKMKNFTFKRIIIACSILAVFSLTACGSEKPSDLLIGTWVSDDDEIVEFMDDGSCTAPFTYNASWWESAERYTLKDDGTLVLSSKEGHADDSFDLAESEEEALDDSGAYFVSEDKLIIDGDEYTKTE